MSAIVLLVLHKFILSLLQDLLRVLQLYCRDGVLGGIRGMFPVKVFHLTTLCYVIEPGSFIYLPFV